MRHYILEGHRPVYEPNLLAWAQWFEHAERTVAFTHHELFTVSTVFLGLNHRFSDKGPPMLFESMAFIDGESSDCRRYSSWDDAEIGHRAMVRDLVERAVEARNVKIEPS